MMLAKISVESSDDDAADDFPKLGGITEPQKEKNSKMTTQMAPQDHQHHPMQGNR